MTYLEYFKLNCYSFKSKRFFLVEEYYRLCDLKRFKLNSVYYNEWLKFEKIWFK